MSPSCSPRQLNGGVTSNVLGPDQLLTHHLKLVSKLGQGGMGSVWIADHLALNTQVAVKVLREEFAQDEQALARFRREATAAARIDSAHVVRVFDHGVADGHPYIVMELLSGEDLRRRIQRQQRLELADVVTLVNQVGKALARAHGLGVVHRDIKPDNLFLTAEGDDLFVKVLDFGVAKAAFSSEIVTTHAGSLVGTPHYMSPEQLLGEPDVDARTDLWSLAVVAYHALAGRRPFEGDSIAAISLRVHAGRFAPITELRPELPSGLDRFFERALQLAPSRRFQSARDLVEGFLLACGATPTSLPAHAITPAFRRSFPSLSLRTDSSAASVQTVTARSRPRRIVLVSGLLTVALLVLGGVLAVLMSGPRRRRTGAEDSASTPLSRVASGPEVVPLDTSGHAVLSPSQTPPQQPRLRKVEKDRGLVVTSSSASTRVPTVPSAPPPRPLKDRGF